MWGETTNVLAWDKCGCGNSALYRFAAKRGRKNVYAQTFAHLCSF